MTASKQPLKFQHDKLIMLDQTRLPGEEIYLELGNYLEVATAIKDMKVRGAPAIGVTAAYGVALGGLAIQAATKDRFLTELANVIRTIEATRPTARNLFMATERMKAIAQKATLAQIKEALVNEAVKIHQEEAAATERLSRFGAELIEDGFTVLTHCNTGALATTGYGTALGVIRYAWEQKRRIKVMADETRPRLQGAHLTAWELKQAAIPFTLITDSMAGHFMARGEISCVIVGADRIAGNGDTANKIGTYSLAVLAKAHDIPFYIAAPTTTIDPEIASGEEIVIEERDPEEVTHIKGVGIAPEGTRAANPAFDVTPHHLISAIITEEGIAREPYTETLNTMTKNQQKGGP